MNNYRYKSSAVAFLIILLVACGADRPEKVSKPKSKSYGYGFGDSSIKLPTNEITIGSSKGIDSSWLENIRKVRNDSIQKWKIRLEKHLKTLDSLFWVTSKKMQLSTIDAQFAKAIIDSMNKIDKWDADCWEYHLASNDQMYNKWKWIPNGEVGGLIAKFKKQLSERKLVAKWDFQLKVYTLNRLIP